MVFTVSPITATKERLRSSWLEETPVNNADIADVGHIGGGSDDGGVFADQVVALEIGGVIAIGAVKHAVAIDRFQKALFGDSHRLVALDLIEIFAAAQAPTGGDLGYQKGFRAESLGGALLGVHA